MTTIGLVHPGSMGARIGAALRAAGHDVAWVRAGRSVETARRAQDAGLRPVGATRTLARECRVVISVCPPGHAVEVARELSLAGFKGLYVDANAVSPATAIWIGSLITDAGGRFVDAGIIGPPPVAADTTRMALSGRHASEVVKLFAGTVLTTIDLGERIGAASAFKMAYAGWTKTTSALLLALRSYARAWGLEDALLAEWEQSLPDLTERSSQTARTIHRKAWRFVDEMQFIADAFAEVGLPPGFHAAAAETFAALSRLKDDPADQEPGAVYDMLRGNPRSLP
jgi:3-hydroxyisobutyrate dehydrogenase-like beta-hydroxyacid dehydrogenase